MGFYESLVRPLAFKIDPERVHNLAVWLISQGLVRARPFEDARLRQTLFGVEFPNPLGLAAGFDKNAAAVDHWHRLGFGYAELGTITHLAQPGNPKPRLFRLPKHRALINRMGFNNDGAEAVAARLSGSTPKLPIGINLGKSKVTELQKAPDDYRESFRLLRTYGAYFVVNVSSPNTPGLRSLQERGPLLEIVSAIRSVDAAMPLLIKVAPDLETPALDEVVQVAHEAKATGLIATNTTISREGIDGPNAAETGGLSGAPLRDRSNQFLSHLYASCDRSKILIGVGGIFSGADLYEKIRLGAHLCQTYTGWIYGGPGSTPRMLRELVALMERDGIASLAELRGSAAARS
ncbi:MAG TPA: quinone-dependent dihydroorotate dehydrogenase [Fimbriimonadaceae bacterium]|nr:quinone-dependent dihydroorotate dehydrogenase [Fimbriimonadaceae bacterium]